jgi:hypothetical protein
MPDGASFRVLPNEAPARVVPASLPGRSVLSPGGSGNLLRLQNRARVESRWVRGHRRLQHVIGEEKLPVIGDHHDLHVIGKPLPR